MIATESNTLSDTGSMRLCISAFTDTIGFMAPQSAGSGLPPGATALVVEDVEDGVEQAVIAARASSPAPAIRFRARGTAISAPVQVVFMRRGAAPQARVETRPARS